jgi:thimet oligopeptidase
LAAVLLAGAAMPAYAASGKISSDAEATAFLAKSITTATTAAEIGARCEAGVALARKEQTALEARKVPATLKGDYQAFDTINLVMGDVGNEMYLVSETNTSKDVRDAAEACLPKISDVGTAVSLSRPIYDRLAAIPTTGLDARVAFALKHQLIEYRLAGVDKDAATRAKVTELQKAIVETGLKFDGNIRDDKGDIALKPEDLKGLPQDYIAAHKPGADGLVHITYDYPDSIPVFQFADIRETRRKVMTAYLNRGYPANGAVLKTLLQQRYDLARLLGYPNYAAYVMADKMVDTPEKAASFLEDVNAAAKPGTDADYAEVATFAKTVDPSIDRLQAYDVSYLENKLRKQKYDVDQAEVRQYFTRDKAQAGIFQLVHDLFGADIRPWKTDVWSKDVTAWELYDNNKLVGRFYLDLSPRAGKYNHEAQFPLRTGVEGRQIPMGALICNFPATGPMSQSDVTTFLHEFGHLIHDMYSGHTQYATQSMGYIPQDFIEAPSQLLEEWTFNYDTLKRFAANDKGEAIPEALVKKMNAARHFGEAGQWKRQIMYAEVSLNMYNRDPSTVDPDALWTEETQKYSIYPVMPDTHSWASFGHLNGYSAVYYTYVWDKAIALDLFTKFKANGLRDGKTAMAYRHDVLDPGASEDANDLVKSFLGRDISLEAFKKELAGKD